MIKQSVTIRDTGVAAADILRLISQGFSYDQILRDLSGLTMADIMATADLARRVIEQLVNEHGRIEVNHEISFVFADNKPVVIENVRRKFPRAYKPWTDREDNNLAEMFKRGVAIDEIARQHRRQPGAIRIRLERLGLRR